MRRNAWKQCRSWPLASEATWPDSLDSHRLAGWMCSPSASSTVVTGPLMSKSVGFDTFKDFTPISQAVGAPLYLVVNS